MDVIENPMITSAGVASVKGRSHHLYEDRYRLLGGDVPLVEKAGRGHVYAVMDGVRGAPRGIDQRRLLLPVSDN